MKIIIDIFENTMEMIAYIYIYLYLFHNCRSFLMSGIVYRIYEFVKKKHNKYLEQINNILYYASVIIIVIWLFNSQFIDKIFEGMNWNLRYLFYITVMGYHAVNLVYFIKNR